MRISVFQFVFVYKFREVVCRKFQQMLSTRAETVDALRSMQRDELAIKALEENIQSLFKFFGMRNYRAYSRHIPMISSLWYYYVTSGNNLQTLGEEYSNVLRLTNDNIIPSKMIQMIWLILYIGGEPLVNRLTAYMEAQVKSSSELREEARQILLKIISIWNLVKSDLLMIHRAFFYMNSEYFSFSHRIVGIRYVILRDWLVDKSFRKNFQILGSITLIYSIFNILKKIWDNKYTEADESISIQENSGKAVKVCALCNENRKNPSCTPCGHIFCWECIQKCISYTQKCPLCREEVPPSRVIFLQNFL